MNKKKRIDPPWGKNCPSHGPQCAQGKECLALGRENARWAMLVAGEIPNPTATDRANAEAVGLKLG